MRDRSTDSLQSANTSSNQASPKKKVTTLPAVVALDTKLATASSSEPSPIGPPPGLSIRPPPASLPPPAAAEESDTLAESISTESEAGPSTTTPPLQTPARSGEQPPAPLTSDPIIVHSPFEEPRISYFPLSDPAFAFSLGLDDQEVAKTHAQTRYQPSPFSKTLIDLAELGVLLPEDPELSGPLPQDRTFSGIFQPFDTDLDAIDLAQDESAEVEEVDGPRTSSRFDFARPSSASHRGQSPFTMRRIDDMRNGWVGGPGSDHAESSGSRGTPGLTQNFTGHYALGGAESAWSGGGIGGGDYTQSPQRQGQQYDREGRYQVNKPTRDHDDFDQSE